MTKTHCMTGNNMSKLLSLIIISALIIFCFTGCASKFIAAPVKFNQGITDSQILSYAGDLKIMYTKGVYGGSIARFGSTVLGRSSAIAASIWGGGILPLITLGSYEAQDIFDTKGKAMIYLYGLQRIEAAEITYGQALLRLRSEKKEKGKLTQRGLDLYKTILNTKAVMAKMLMGQVPEKNEL